MLVGKYLADGGRVEASPGAEFFYGDELMILLVQTPADDVHHLATVALTAAGNKLDVLRVNA